MNEFVDMHVHSKFSIDGMSTMEDYCLIAGKTGTRVICFTEHVDFNSAEKNLSIVKDIMSNNDVPIWEKYTLTIEEASKYFRIGENKLRRLAEENPSAGWVILNGNRIQIKRQKFEKIIDSLDTI